MTATDAWVVFTHRLGGDMVAVQTDDEDTASRALAALFGYVEEELLEDSDCCCGPDWTVREYFDPTGDDEGDPDGPTTFPSRPEEAEVLLVSEPRPDGTPRSTFVTAQELPGLLAAYETLEPQTPADDDGDDEGVDYNSCC